MAQEKESGARGKKTLQKDEEESGARAPVKRAAKKNTAKKKTSTGKGGAKDQAPGAKQNKHANSKRKPPVKPDPDKDDAAGKPDPFEIARQTVKGSVPDIVKTMVEKAKNGSCPHAKTLLEMTGARYMFEDEADGLENGEPWAKLVLERLSEAEKSQDEQVSTREASEE